MQILENHYQKTYLPKSCLKLYFSLVTVCTRSQNQSQYWQSVNIWNYWCSLLSLK